MANIKISQELRHHRTSLRDSWIAWRGVGRSTRYLWKSGELNTTAHGLRGALSHDPTDEDLYNSPSSAYCRTKEECIAVCEKFGYEYEVEEPYVEELHE